VVHCIDANLAHLWFQVVSPHMYGFTIYPNTFMVPSCFTTYLRFHYISQHIYGSPIYPTHLGYLSLPTILWFPYISPFIMVPFTTPTYVWFPHISPLSYGYLIFPHTLFPYFLISSERKGCTTRYVKAT